MGAQQLAEIRPVRVSVGEAIVLDADLSLPTGAGAVVLFAHGSGSSRLSPRITEAPES